VVLFFEGEFTNVFKTTDEINSLIILSANRFNLLDEFFFPGLNLFLRKTPGEFPLAIDN